MQLVKIRLKMAGVGEIWVARARGEGEVEMIIMPYYYYHKPPKPTFLEVFMVNNLVLRWPKPFIFHGFGGSWYI